MPEIPPLLRARFAPGSSVTDKELSQFYTFLPRNDGEAAMAYAQRLVAAGFVRLTTSEQMRDLAAFRQLSKEAEVQGVPVLVMTANVTTPVVRELGPIRSVDDILDRATGQMHASGDAGPNRNDPYTAATKAATEAANPGHAAGGNSGSSK